MNSARMWTYNRDIAQGQVPVNMVLNFQVPQKDGTFLANWGAINFWWAPLHAIILTRISLTITQYCIIILNQANSSHRNARNSTVFLCSCIDQQYEHRKWAKKKVVKSKKKKDKSIHPRNVTFFPPFCKSTSSMDGHFIDKSGVCLLIHQKGHTSRTNCT
jgi:hypothetical protein